MHTPGLHGVLHAPQWAGSLASTAHLPPQSVVPGGQSGWHDPALQTVLPPGGYAQTSQVGPQQAGSELESRQ
jgi:hypothetical protein